jgi:nitrite reductase/ring-hydroxylating ferredoxin subunit
MSRTTDVGPSEDLAADGSFRVVKIGGRDIAVVRWDGRLYAFKNICPHQGAPLCGDLGPQLHSDRPGSVRSVRSAPVVQCGWHRWEFDLQTGRALYDDKMRVKTYDVREEGGRVFIDI